MPHIKVVFLWPYARVGGVHPAYARAYAYAYHLCICIPPTEVTASFTQNDAEAFIIYFYLHLFQSMYCVLRPYPLFDNCILLP